ncbi:MAG: hypothetical protein INR72_15050 [Williamsia herbipolensis]|nr:hypothetical protein [Williamsia herbipolensis]
MSPQDPSRPRRIRRVAPVVSALLVPTVVAAVLTAAGPAQAASRHPHRGHHHHHAKVFFGAVGQSRHELRKVFHARVANHSYGQLTGGVPKGRMITMRDSGVKWSAVASAKPGSSIYANIVRWADTLKTRRGPIFFAYHHEPEASGSSTYGTAANFKAAFRHVVTIFRHHGVHNVRYTWQMTSWSFQTSHTDPRAAWRWYPGDKYVDVVSSDAYNWFTNPPGVGVWQQLASVGNPTLKFAKAHHKTVVFGEYGCAASSRRAGWLRAVKKYFIKHRDIIRGAFYFQLSTDYDWRLKTAAEMSAFRSAADDRKYFRS